MSARRAIAACAAAAVSMAAQAALKPGDAAPSFEATASLAGHAQPFALVEALKRGPVVVYFYPAAFTGGCSVQAHEFATLLPEFERAGASIVGVSLDGIERLNAFSVDPQSCGGRVRVASDPNGAIAKAFDLSVKDDDGERRNRRGELIGHGLAERTTFVIARGGKVAATIANATPADNVHQALDAVRRLQAPAR
jgi:peroxiredoxin